MGSDALLSSGVTEKMLYLIRDRRAISPSDPLNKVRKSRIVLFTAVELVGFGATFAITQVSDSGVWFLVRLWRCYSAKQTRDLGSGDDK